MRLELIVNGFAYYVEDGNDWPEMRDAKTGSLISNNSFALDAMTEDLYEIGTGKAEPEYITDEMRYNAKCIAEQWSE